MAETRYQRCTVHIRTKYPEDHLPAQQHLRSFLRDFGAIAALCEWRWEHNKNTPGQPNNALVRFESPDTVDRILSDYSNLAPDSFWVTQSLSAQTPRPSYFQLFYWELCPNKTNGAPRSSTRQPWSERQSPGPSSRRPPPSSTDDRPPPKRPRNDPPPPEPTPSGSRASSNDGSALHRATRVKFSRTPSATPESTEWMRGRIAQLETELEAARAARDMAISEQNVALVAHEAEKQARREALAQKSAAEAAQARVEAEQARLLAGLGNAQPSKVVETLRIQLAAVEEKLKEAQDSLAESTKADERIKALEAQLEEAQDQSHKLQIQKSELKLLLEEARSEAAQPDKSAEVERLEAELGSAQEKLESTQKSLEAMQRKYSMKQGKYEATREKLGRYKARLQSENAIIKKLQETLTPAAYNSLGATHQTLGAFLSAMGLPPIGDQEPKEEPKDEPKEETE